MLLDCGWRVSFFVFITGEVERRIKDGILEFPTQPRAVTLRPRHFDSA